MYLCRLLLVFVYLFRFSFPLELERWSSAEGGSSDKSLEVNSPRFLFGSRPNGNVSILRLAPLPPSD